MTGSMVLLALRFLTPYFYYIPKASLAAVIGKEIQAIWVEKVATLSCEYIHMKSFSSILIGIKV